MTFLHEAVRDLEQELDLLAVVLGLLLRGEKDFVLFLSYMEPFIKSFEKILQRPLASFVLLVQL